MVRLRQAEREESRKSPQVTEKTQVKGKRSGEEGSKWVHEQAVRIPVADLEPNPWNPY